jgi:hypothetical protein
MWREAILYKDCFGALRLAVTAAYSPLAPRPMSAATACCAEA